jgi:hypothetical protein
MSEPESVHLFSASAVYKHRYVSFEEKHLNPWSVRAEFLALDTPSALTAFLNKTGMFNLPDEEFRDLVGWQVLIRALMIANPQRWGLLAGRLDKRKVKLALREDRADCRFTWTDRKPCARLWTAYTLRAMVVSIQVDHLRGAKFRFCMKPDCGKPYEVTSSHARLYCSQECAHHASVRRNREKHRQERRRQPQK